MKLVPIEEFKLSVVKFFIHVWFRDSYIDEVEQDEIRYVDEEEQFKNGVALLEDGRPFLFESEDRLYKFHDDAIL